MTIYDGDTVLRALVITSQLCFRKNATISLNSQGMCPTEIIAEVDS